MSCLSFGTCIPPLLLIGSGGGISPLHSHACTEPGRSTCTKRSRRIKNLISRNKGSVCQNGESASARLGGQLGGDYTVFFLGSSPFYVGELKTK